MSDRDSRRWIKVFPRNFSNQYFFMGFESQQQKEKFIDKVNSEQDSSAYNCRKSKVEQVEEYQEITGYTNLKGVYTIYGTDTDILQFIDYLN